MTDSLHRGTDLDVLEAARFYRREGGAKLANRFLDEFERVAGLLVRFPDIGTPAGDLCRVQSFQDFPYSDLMSFPDGEATAFVRETGTCQ